MSADTAEFYAIIVAAILIIGVLYETARIWMRHTEHRDEERRIEQWRRRRG